jgi:hypothetical protein
MSIRIHFSQLSKLKLKNEKLVFVFVFRIKEHQLSEMEEDLIFEKIFDLTIELKDISIIVPENGFYQK